MVYHAFSLPPSPCQVSTLFSTPVRLLLIRLHTAVILLFCDTSKGKTPSCYLKCLFITFSAGFMWDLYMLPDLEAGSNVILYRPKEHVMDGKSQGD